MGIFLEKLRLPFIPGKPNKPNKPIKPIKPFFFTGQRPADRPATTTILKNAWKKWTTKKIDPKKWTIKKDEPKKWTITKKWSKKWTIKKKIRKNGRWYHQNTTNIF